MTREERRDRLELDAIAPSSAARAIYSIGAVARMVGIDTATLRAWEDRYAVVVPARSRGGQRLYSREQVDFLQFLMSEIGAGSTPADAHRLLADRLSFSEPATSIDPGPTAMLVLLVERDRYAAELFDFFLRTEGYDVAWAASAGEADRFLAQTTPRLCLIELVMANSFALCRRLAGKAAVPVLAVSTLDYQDEALAAGASAFLQKPLEQLQVVSAVRDLLGESAMTRRHALTART